MASSTFGAEVLIGNWAERRYAVVEQSNAILPGLRVSGCEHHRSLCQDTYTRAPFDRAETVPFFVQHRKLAYQNFVRNRRSGLNLVDHELLKRNFTTTNTLEFQELPRLRLLHANRDTEKRGPPKQPADVDPGLGIKIEKRFCCEWQSTARLKEPTHFLRLSPCPK